MVLGILDKNNVVSLDRRVPHIHVITFGKYRVVLGNMIVYVFEGGRRPEA